MRLTGPVLAGLIWSLSTKSIGIQPISVTDLHHVSQSSSPEHRLQYVPEFSQTYAQQPSPQSTFSLADGVERALQEPRTFWTIARGVVGGSTSVFYLVGVICILNFVACHVLAVSSSSVTPEQSKYIQRASGGVAGQRAHQHGQEECSVSGSSRQDREPCRVHDLPTPCHLTA
ncbi:hypothetical protein EDD21DRAFT_386756 [Dissophora ornata]|nr:hypothetical protein EDD21DRAFT_386756 [Dissophora ornata]